MTQHQQARRAMKSKQFFARHAERAALAGNMGEAMRLLTAATRKRSTARLARLISELHPVR